MVRIAQAFTALDAASAQAQHEVERRLLLDVVVRERAAVLEPVMFSIVLSVCCCTLH